MHHLIELTHFWPKPHLFHACDQEVPSDVIAHLFYIQLTNDLPIKIFYLWINSFIWDKDDIQNLFTLHKSMLKDWNHLINHLFEPIGQDFPLKFIQAPYQAGWLKIF